MQDEICEGCGRHIRGGQSACRAQFDTLLARDFSVPAFFRSHRLFVDIYALQHPGQFCVSTKSLAAHLADLGAILEYSADPATGFEPLNHWLNGNRPLEVPSPPPHRGHVTLGDVVDTDVAAWGLQLRRWAGSVWAAYGELQPWARQILAAAHGA